MKQFLNRKNKSALTTLTSLCSDLLLVYSDEISKIYNILILEVLIGKPSKGFVKYLEVAIARLLSRIDADNLRFVRDASSVYLITKLVESVFKRYREHTRYKYPLELLHFDVIISGKYNMADSFSDFLINKDPHRKDTDICLFIALSESYFSFVKQRNRRFKLARNMVKTNDVGTILAVLYPEDSEGFFINDKGNIYQTYYNLRNNNRMVVDDDLADKYVEIIVNEIDFWSYIFEHNEGEYFWTFEEGFSDLVKEVKDLHISNLDVVDAEGKRAYTKGDYVRAKKMYESFIRASERYRSAIGITRSYKYTSTKKMLKWLECQVNTN